MFSVAKLAAKAPTRGAAAYLSLREVTELSQMIQKSVSKSKSHSLSIITSRLPGASPLG